MSLELGTLQAPAVELMERNLFGGLKDGPYYLRMARRRPIDRGSAPSSAGPRVSRSLTFSVERLRLDWPRTDTSIMQNALKCDALEARGKALPLEGNVDNIRKRRAIQWNEYVNIQATSSNGSWPASRAQHDVLTLTGLRYGFIRGSHRKLHSIKLDRVQGTAALHNLDSEAKSLESMLSRA